jgi:threonine dehydrogenase-like Zn-dependent dehydrogenase
VSLVEAPMPTGAPDQLTVRITRVAICGSDLHELNDNPPGHYPYPPGFSGHECVGIIEESNSPGLPRGGRVLFLPTQNLALAEYATVSPDRVILLPDSLDWDQGVLSQQLGTVIYMCRKLENVLDKNVVVVGQGPAGLWFSALLYRMGAKQVIGLDVVDHRLEIARRIGAQHTINTQHTDVVAVVSDLTQGQMADLVVEACGKTETINLCTDLARPEAEVALFGVPKRPSVMFDYEKFLRRQVRIVYSVGAQAEPGLRSFRLALDMLEQGRLDARPLISHQLLLKDVRHGFWLAESKEDGAVKVVLDVS